MSTFNSNPQNNFKLIYSKSRPNNFRQASAAEQNRQYHARAGIMKAIARLAIPRTQWPDFVEAQWSNGSERIPFRQVIAPPKFEPPVFDRLNQSPQEYRKKADALWEQHRERFLQGCEAWVKQGLDDAIPATDVRGPGKPQRPRTRQNSAMEDRFEWAALRSCGEAWKEIAARYGTKESTVTKAASEVLRTAGWPTKLKTRTSTP